MRRGYGEPCILEEPNPRSGILLGTEMFAQGFIALAPCLSF